MFKAVSVFLLFMSFSLLAQEVTVKVTTPFRHRNYELGIGTRVELDFKTRNVKKPAIFLGRMVDLERRSIEFLFLDEKKTRISMIDPENIEGIRQSTAQPVVSPIDQIGSTCLAYGVFHFWNQIYISNFLL